MSALRTLCFALTLQPQSYGGVGEGVVEFKGSVRQLVGVPQIPRSYLDQTVCLPAWFGSPDLHTSFWHLQRSCVYGPNEPTPAA